MAIFAPSISVLTRGKTSSAVASSAYISRTELRNEREGRSYNYSNVHNYERVVADLGVMLPPQAPLRLSDRSILWNEVEGEEKRSNAQLARKVMIPLPDELSDEQAVALARRIVASRVEEGHIVDAAIHCSAAFPGDEATEAEKTRADRMRKKEARLGNKPARNIHLHWLEPLRPVGEEGFLPKSECVYLCRTTDGQEAYLSAADLQRAQEIGDSWAKVYKYKGKRLLTKDEALAAGLHPTKDRVNKQPMTKTHYLTNWNDADRAEVWREQWAGLINEALEAAHCDARVDHRSYERRGLDVVPQAHEGPEARGLERMAQEAAAKRGVEYEPVTDVRKHNEAVAQTNKIVRKLKAARDVLRLLIERISTRIERLHRSAASQTLELRREVAAAAHRQERQPQKPGHAKAGGTRPGTAASAELALLGSELRRRQQLYADEHQVEQPTHTQQLYQTKTSTRSKGRGGR